MIAGLPVGNPQDEEDEDDGYESVEHPRITVAMEITIDPNKYGARAIAMKGGPEQFAQGLVEEAMNGDGELYLAEHCDEWKITRVGPWTGIPE